MVIFEVYAYLFEFKEGDQILNQVQPQEYIEYFEDSAEASLKCRNLSLTQKSGKQCHFAKVSKIVALFFYAATTKTSHYKQYTLSPPVLLLEGR